LKFLHSMKNYIFIISLLLFFACKEQKSKEDVASNQSIVPKVFVLKSSKNVSVGGDTVYVDNKKYSGFLYELYPKTTDTLSLEGYSDGLLSGVSKRWYENIMLMEERYFEGGKKNGKNTAFWGNGKKKFQFTAKNDAYEGEMTEWTSDGKLYHVGNYVNGQEEGSQKMWYDNGKIRANYVIRNGKRFGLLGTKNCKNVSDSIFVIK
jgi:antitoxin component YwqK of YwqJK toxin-antitoxin module